MFSVVKDMEQGTEEWLQYRRKHVTATDAGKILQEVPPEWGTPYSCWHAKVMDTRIVPNKAMMRGNELEQFARTAYNAKTGIEYVPQCVLSDEYPWMMSSLDGLSRDRNSAVEFKCPGENTHRKAKRGIMPPYYNSQMQHHMCILGFDKMDYVSYFANELIILTIHRDQSYIDNLVQKGKEFYDCLINLDPPESTLEAYEEETSEDARMIKFNLEAAVAQKKKLEKIITEHKDSLKEIADGRNIKIDNMKVRKKVKPGSIQYGEIPELSGVDFSQYRKDSTEFYTFTF